MRKSIGSKFYVANIHAGGRDYINLAIQHAKTNGAGKQWIVAGDFNQNANEDLSWMDMRGGDIIAPAKATRPSSGKILDYAVRARIISGQRAYAGPTTAVLITYASTSIGD
ncbi:hypothetical protein Q9L42_009855 [Methylomarinum sp. Ch1-1]|uniref:Endonuclease/exonuclease/phosphatase domain-containing protein n=1 Tax=Methylomarinum roseum TaxID=3067653 RepID=A0AAU7NZV2_9GAMM